MKSMKQLKPRKLRRYNYSHTIPIKRIRKRSKNRHVQYSSTKVRKHTKPEIHSWTKLKRYEFPGNKQGFRLFHVFRIESNKERKNAGVLDLPSLPRSHAVDSSTSKIEDALVNYEFDTGKICEKQLDNKNKLDKDPIKNDLFSEKSFNKELKPSTSRVMQPLSKNALSKISFRYTDYNLRSKTKENSMDFYNTDLETKNFLFNSRNINLNSFKKCEMKSSISATPRGLMLLFENENCLLKINVSMEQIPMFTRPSDLSIQTCSLPTMYYVMDPITIDDDQLMEFIIPSSTLPIVCCCFSLVPSSMALVITSISTQYSSSNKFLKSKPHHFQRRISSCSEELLELNCQDNIEKREVLVILHSTKTRKNDKNGKRYLVSSSGRLFEMI